MTKMKYILYTGLALLLCAGCSKDHGDSIESLPDAKIALQFKATGVNKGKSLKAATKASADANELDGEANINNISALVFNQAGTELLATPYFTEVSAATDGVVTITDIPAKAAVAQIVLVANAGSGAFNNVNSYSDFETVLCRLSDQSQSDLTMSSQVIETSQPLAAGDENYLGYSSMGDANINGISSPLELTRLAARLDVVNVKTNFTKSLLSGRSVKIQSIAIANRKTASRFFSPDYWGSVMVPGYLDNSAETALNLDVDNNTALGTIAFSNYVMENDGSENPTELLITATLSARAPYLEETRVFGAVINENGSSRFGHDYIKRNYVYKIALTFGDDTFEGNKEEEYIPTPPPVVRYGSVDVAITAAEWNTEVIEVPNVDY